MKQRHLEGCSELQYVWYGAFLYALEDIVERVKNGRLPRGKTVVNICMGLLNPCKLFTPVTLLIFGCRLERTKSAA
jgi:hypothetical protein